MLIYNILLFTIIMQENKEGLELLKAAIAKAGYTGKVLRLSTSYFGHWIYLLLYNIESLYVWQVVIGTDVAASEFFSEKDKTYDLNFKEDVRCSELSLV
jgi:enolase